jgi:hypothetical protein
MRTFISCLMLQLHGPVHQEPTLAQQRMGQLAAPFSLNAPLKRGAQLSVTPLCTLPRDDSTGLKSSQKLAKVAVRSMVGRDLVRLGRDDDGP